MAKEIMGRKLYEVDEIAGMLGVMPRTIRDYIRKGKLKGSKFDKRWHVTQDELNRFLSGESERPNKALLTIMSKMPGVEKDFDQLDDKTRRMFNVWAELSDEQRALIADEIIKTRG